MKRWLGRLLLALAPILIIGVTGEVFLRVATARTQAKNAAALDTLFTERPEMNQAVATLPDLLRGSDYAEMVYELRPDLSVEFMGATVTTDANGFRNPAPSIRKAPGVFRIVGLGDSSMFGWGVHDHVTDYTKTAGIAQIQGSPLTVSKTDPHYSPLGHALIAEHLFDHLRDLPEVQSRINRLQTTD